MNRVSELTDEPRRRPAKRPANRSDAHPSAEKLKLAVAQYLAKFLQIEGELRGRIGRGNYRGQADWSPEDLAWRDRELQKLRQLAEVAGRSAGELGEMIERENRQQKNRKGGTNESQS